MRTQSTSGSTAAATLAAEAARCGIKPPYQLIGRTDASHGWLVAGRDGDCIFADEFGDLFWAVSSGTRVARIVRAVWPEEAAKLANTIECGVRAALGD